MHWTQGASHPLIGHDVLIDWCDRRQNDWRHYTVIAYHDGWILLRGRSTYDEAEAMHKRMCARVRESFADDDVEAW